MTDFNVIIAGGGTPGITLALLLAQADLSVAVIDPIKVTASAQETRTSALMKGSVDIFQSIGVWGSCADRGGVMTGLRIADDDAEQLFESEEIGQEFFGINMPNNILRDALLAQARKTKNITLHIPASLQSFIADDAGVSVTLENGEMLTASLLVGADGRNSAVRQQAGIDVWGRDYNQSALTCIINHSRAHQNVSTEFHYPGGPFTLVPLPGNMSSVVWVEYNDDAKQLAAINRSAFEQTLQDKSHSILSAITLEAGPQLSPLKALKAKALIAPRVALVAEAAHVLHPLGAQGLNLSIRDAAALAEVIIDAVNLGLDPGSTTILKKYQARRQRDIEMRVRGTDLFNKFVSTSSPFMRNLRRAGIKTVGSLSILRDLAMREGLGR